MEGQDYYQEILNKTVDKNIPFKVFWELTYSCNLNCQHCYVRPYPKREELNQEEIKRALKQLYEMGALFITFSGGEVLTRPDFFAIASYARSLGLAVRILTNATLIDAGVTETILELHPLSVEISLYAMRPAIHDAITRHAGSFVKTVSAIKLLKEKGLEVVIKSPLMESNIAEFAALKDFASRLSCRWVFDLNIIPRQDGDSFPLRYRLGEERLREFFVSVGAGRYWGKREIQDAEPVCDAGLNSLCVSPYGEVFPCVGARIKMGALRENSIKEIWQNRAFEEFCGQNRFSRLHECRQCHLLAYCRRCPGVAHLEDGDFRGRSTAACRITRLQYSLFK
ncbi:MAG: radical SAM protein [Candidatus Omnitrophota bacterium]